MCGIVGLLHRNGGDAEALRDGATRMSDLVRHRGPDDDDLWIDPSARFVVAFRRLSILDLSPLGRQPMRSESGRFVMCLNGEVYNFRELRGELQAQGVSFRGGSDTEVLLAAFDRWGPDVTLPKLNGMFAITLWDQEREELLLVRDRLGIKPVYVARTSEGVAFASELGALTEAPGIDLALDPAATASYLGYLWVPAPATPLRHVRKLRPGHFLRLSPNDLDGDLPASEPYWSLDDARAAGVRARTNGARHDGPEGALDRLEEVVTDAVRLRMVADVPVGAFLSGGIDSSLVVALMQTLATERVKTFTIGFDQPEHDESEHARAIAAHLGTEHTELMVTDEDALALVPRLPEIFDEPLADPSQMPTYLVSELARRRVTVALSGDGGDELFAGYSRYAAARGMLGRIARSPAVGRRWLGAVLRSVRPSLWDRFQAASNGRTRLLAQKAYKLGRMLDAPNAGEMYRTLLSAGADPGRFMPDVDAGADPVARALSGIGPMSLGDMLFVDQRYYLPDDLLQKVDRASMAVSLEARVPLLDHRVVELSWTMADELKIREGEGKWLLRQLLYRHVPRELLERPKTGFSVPVEAWLRGALREFAEHHLLGASTTRDALFSATAIREAWRRLLDGRNEDALGLWAILTFEAWRARWKIEDAYEPAAQAPLTA